MAENWKKRGHSQTLLALLYIAHLLPLAWWSEEILNYIFRPGWTEIGLHPCYFHADFNLDGWNDYIIQPARDAVLDYYKVRTCIPHLQCLRLYLFNIKLYLFSESAQRNAIRRRGVHARQ